jgi:hypothetical protein
MQRIFDVSAMRAALVEFEIDAEKMPLGEPVMPVLFPLSSLYLPFQVVKPSIDGRHFPQTALPLFG